MLYISSKILYLQAYARFELTKACLNLFDLNNVVNLNAISFNYHSTNLSEVPT